MLPTRPRPPRPTPRARARTARLAEAVANFARAIDAGEVAPEVPELQALAALCDERRLPREAARIRRWLNTTEVPT